MFWPELCSCTFIILRPELFPRKQQYHYGYMLVLREDVCALEWLEEVF